MCDFGNGRIRGWQKFKPNVYSLSVVANALGVTVDDLLRGFDAAQ